jgi:hypothetical protein
MRDALFLLPVSTKRAEEGAVLGAGGGGSVVVVVVVVVRELATRA